MEIKLFSDLFDTLGIALRDALDLCVIRSFMRVNIAQKKNKITSDVRFPELTLLYELIHFSATWSGVKFTARL